MPGRLIALSQYRPTRVLYDENARGVFVQCDEKATPALFGNRPVLDFPHELHDVAAIRFKLVVCLNSRSPLVGALRALADSLCERHPNADRSAIEEQCVEMVIERHERGLPGEDPAEFKRYFLHRLQEAGVTEVNPVRRFAQVDDMSRQGRELISQSSKCLIPVAANG